MSDHDYDAFVARFMVEEAPHIVADVQEQFVQWLADLQKIAARRESLAALQRRYASASEPLPATTDELACRVQTAIVNALGRLVELATPTVDDLRRQRN